MNDRSPGLLVAVPTCNGAERIGPLLCALAVQTLPPAAMDVLVIDNGSLPGTAAAIEQSDGMRELTARYNARVLAVSEPGLTNARIKAVTESRREIVLFLDDDTRPSPECCAQALLAFDEPRVGVAFGRVYPLYSAEPGGAVRKREGVLAMNYRLGDAPRVWKAADDLAPTLGAALAVRVGAFLEAYPWREPGLVLPDRIGARLVSGGDIEIGLFLGRKGWWRQYAPGMIVRHAIEPSRLTTRRFCHLIVSIERSRATVEEKFNLPPPRLARRLRALVELAGIVVLLPIWCVNRDGFRGWVFALTSRLGRLAGAYTARRTGGKGPS